MPKGPVYLDANGTTVVPDAVKKAMCKWINEGNPSSAYDSAAGCRKMMAEFRDHVAKLCSIVSGDTPRQSANPRAYQLVITSGASESNSTIIRSAVEAYTFRRKLRPHIISSAAEHKCVLQCLARLSEVGAVDVAYVGVDREGRVDPEDVRRAIKSNTALITIMGANNETGAINDLRAIGDIAAAARVPFHCDAAQVFGKAPFFPLEWSVSAFSLSLHKAYGPKGVGVLAVRQDFRDGYQLGAVIAGAQNGGLRGGTENVAGIAGATAGLQFAFTNLAAKLARLARMRDAVVARLAAAASVVTFPEYCGARAALRPALEFVILTPGVDPAGGAGADRALALPNTLLLAVVSRVKKVCNAELRDALQGYGGDRGFIVSIGSACNTSSPAASHVIRAMGADDVIARGTIRVSFSHTTRAADAGRFAEALLAVSEKYA
jgi:cysteine desulfurase